APIQLTGSAGDAGLSAGTGIAINGAVTVPTGSTVALLTATGDITQTSPITATYTSAVATAGNVSLNDGSNSIGTIAGSAGGTTGFTFDDGIAFSIGNVVAVGSIPAVNGVTAANVSAGSNAVTLQTLSGSNDITLA